VYHSILGLRVRKKKKKTKKKKITTVETSVAEANWKRPGGRIWHIQDNEHGTYETVKILALAFRSKSFKSF